MRRWGFQADPHARAPAALGPWNPTLEGQVDQPAVENTQMLSRWVSDREGDRPCSCSHRATTDTAAPDSGAWVAAFPGGSQSRSAAAAARVGSRARAGRRCSGDGAGARAPHVRGGGAGPRARGGAVGRREVHPCERGRGGGPGKTRHRCAATSCAHQSPSGVRGLLRQRCRVNVGNMIGHRMHITQRSTDSARRLN